MAKIFNLLSGIPLFALFNLKIKGDIIPSFIFHKVKPREFEGLLSYLSSNNYRTLGIDEYYDYLIGKQIDSDRKVILTFDDGLRNNWSIVFPLLKKFAMRAVFYVNPSLLSEKPGLGVSLEDTWNKKVSLEELDKIEEEKQFISWDEARKMESSGLVNIESHGWRHQICFIADKITDFQHPDKDGSPVYHWLFSAIDAKREEFCWGAPVYQYKPRLVATRFFDDPSLRNACISYVRERGERDFFRQSDWRNQLRMVVKKYENKHSLNTRFENEFEQELAIKDSLVKAKERIDGELGKTSLHFAYPWSVSSELSLLWIKELGFKTAFRFMDPYRIPHRGSDPHSLGRIEGYWIKSLPGKGRVSIYGKLLNRLKRQ